MIPEGFSGNRIETYQTDDGKWAWKIENEGAVLASNQGYDDEASLLQGLFSVFFGSYDDSFLALHRRWTDAQRSSGSGNYAWAPEVYVRQSKGNQYGTGDNQC